MSVHEVADQIARLGGIIAGLEKELIAEHIMREHADLEAETARKQRDEAHVLRDATVAQYRDRALAAEQRVAELEAALREIIHEFRRGRVAQRSRTLYDGDDPVVIIARRVLGADA